MDMQKKSSNGISLVPLETCLFGERTIFLEGEIDDAAAMEFIKKLMVLTVEDKYLPIRIMINTRGGEINSGLLIYDAVATCQTPLKMYCLGKAYSMGAVIFAAAPKGNRYMLANSELMAHEPLLGNLVQGSSSTICSVSEMILETKRRLIQILSKHTGRTEEEIELATGYDHFFRAKEAVVFGFADHIIEFSALISGE